MFFLIDGFSNYNQIKMSPWDDEEITSKAPMDNIHYIVMSFDLKNVGATF